MKQEQIQNAGSDPKSRKFEYDGITLTPEVLGHNLHLIMIDERSTTEEARAAFELIRPSLRFKVVEEYMGPQKAAEFHAVKKFLGESIARRIESL